MCLDRTGPLSGTLFSPVAELFMNEIRRSPNNRVMQLDKVRVLGFPKNNWNGNFLTRCRKFETVERSGSGSASSIKLRSVGSIPALLSASFVLPNNEVCVSSFGPYQGRLNAPFRLSLQGIVADLQPTCPSRSGRDKRAFRLYDLEGDFIACCAQGKHCQSKALMNNNEVVLYFGCGRPPIGSDEGFVYAMKDSWIIPVRAHSRLPVERNQIEIVGSLNE